MIRAWERRYDAVRPQRSETRRRLYSDHDIARLVLLRKATEAGRRIGDVAALDESQLQDLLRSDAEAVEALQAPAAQQEPLEQRVVEECLAAVERLDAIELEATLSRAARTWTPAPLMDRIVSPLLTEIGSRWRHGKLEIAQEHLATALIRSLLGLMRIAQTLPVHGPRILVATPAGQSHELGALMVATVAAAAGWRPTYLGPDLPAEEVLAAVSRVGAKAVALSVVYPNSVRALDQLTTVAARLPEGVKLIVGGKAAEPDRARIEAMGAAYLDSFDALEAELDSLS